MRIESQQLGHLGRGRTPKPTGRDLEAVPAKGDIGHREDHVTRHLAGAARGSTESEAKTVATWKSEFGESHSI